jgi:hypothetical protein
MNGGDGFRWCNQSDGAFLRRPRISRIRLMTTQVWASSVLCGIPRNAEVDFPDARFCMLPSTAGCAPDARYGQRTNAFWGGPTSAARLAQRSVVDVTVGMRKWSNPLVPLRASGGSATFLAATVSTNTILATQSPAAAIPKGLMKGLEVAAKACCLLGEFVSEDNLPTCEFPPNILLEVEG